MFIHVLFWFFAGLSVLLGCVSIISGLGASQNGGAMVLGGLAQIVIGPIIVRIWCEVLMIFFKMHDELKEISGKIAPQVKPQTEETGEKSK